MYEYDYMYYTILFYTILFQNTRSSGKCRETRRTLSFDARSFHPSNTIEGNNSSTPGSSSSSTHPLPINHPNNEHLTMHQQQLGDRLYPKVLHHALVKNIFRIYICSIMNKSLFYSFF